jgi:alpha-tubulin suppressor-like RCC1 family protein
MLSLLLTSALMTVSGPQPGYAYCAGFGSASGRQSQGNYYEAGPVQNLGEVIYVSAGVEHSVALRANGQVLAWGNNYQDQLGQGVSFRRLPAAGEPLVVPNLPSATAVAAGAYFTIVAAANGNVYGWGANGDYPLGYTGIKKSNQAIQIPGVSGATALAAGYSHVLALKADGTVWSWGGNSAGQLGRGTTTASAVPQQIPGLTNVVQVSAGIFRSYALKSDGTVWAWGNNSNDGLGLIGGEDAITAPTQIPGLNLISQISTSGNHQVALRDDGLVMTWGSNTEGQLGLPGAPETYAGVPNPTLVPGLSGITRADAGGSTTILGDVDGKVWVAGKSDGFRMIYKTNVFVQAPYVEKMVQASPNHYHSLILSQTETPIWATVAPYEIVGSRTSAVLKLHTEKVLDHDLVLPLSADAEGMQMPLTLTLPAGSSTAEVSVSHPEKVDWWSTTMLALPIGSVRAAGRLGIAPEYLQFQFPEVYGGDAGSALVRVNFPAPPGGLQINLTCNKPGAVKFPASVTIEEGNYAKYFTIQTAPTASLKVVDFVAGYEGVSANGTLYIFGNALGWVKFNKAEVQSGSDVVLTAMVATPAPAGGTVVNLLQGNDQFVMPPTLTVPEGQVEAKITIGTKLQAQDQSVPLTAYVQGSYPKTTYVTLLAAKMVSLTPSNPYPIAGNNVTVTIKLSGPSSGQAITVVSSNPTAVTVPSTVNVGVGETEATFQATTAPGASSSATIKAKLGALYLTTVIAPKLAAPALQSLTFSSSQVTSGGTVTGTITLADKAPSGGAYVLLSSSASKALPAGGYVKVAAGSKTATFTLTAATVTSNRSATITAELQGSTAQSVVKITP